MAKNVNNNVPNLVMLKKGRNQSQQTAIDYFYAVTANGGCMSNGPSGVTDANYDALVKAQLDSFGLPGRALNRLGIDIEQVQEIPPVRFEGFVYSDTDETKFKLGDDHIYRSSKYQVTLLYFSESQVYCYKLTFDSTNNEVTEYTNEYFYKDITNFSYAIDKKEFQVTPKASGGCMATPQDPRYETIDYATFSIIVPGDEMTCTMRMNDERKQAILGMISKLREKKAE